MPDLRQPSTHLLCVAVGQDGQVYAGSDGEGLIYRIARDGKVTVLFDAPQSDVRTLLVLPDGTLYAGTAAEAGPSGGSRNSLFFTSADRMQGLDRPSAELSYAGVSAVESSSTVVRTAQGASPSRATPGRARTSPGGSAAPRPVTSGDNAVYRIDADGVPREVLRVKALIHALARSGDRIWVGTGPEGQLYEIREQGDETAPIARLDSGQVLSLLADPAGGLLIGTGDPGGVLRLSGEYASVGRFVSEVHDTRLVSRFGTMSWRSIQPPGTTIAVQSRSGNVADPDETWSDWSSEQTDPTRAKVEVALRAVRSVPGEAVHDGRSIDARAAVRRAQLSHGQPRPGDRPARRARPQRRRRDRPPDPTEPALGGDGPQRRRPGIPGLGATGGVARLDSPE